MYIQLFTGRPDVQATLSMTWFQGFMLKRKPAIQVREATRQRGERPKDVEGGGRGTVTESPRVTISR